MTGVSLRTLLDQAAIRLAALPTARRDAELLLLRVLQHDRAWLLIHPDACLSPEELALYESWIARRARHEPIQYILGEQEFYGLALRVTPDVLIPRPETEHLVEAVLDRIPANFPARIADVGTGSGAIAVALAHSLPQAKLTALDFSPAALAVACENAARHGLADRIRLLESDLLTAVQGECFDAIVSNPPYVPENEILEPQVRDFEPSSALFAGPAGLDIYRRLIPQARQYLIPGGWLLMEMGHGQRATLSELLSGWDGVSFLDDLAGIPRVAIARRRGSQ